MEDRSRLLLALALAEWASVIAHIETMQRAGIETPDQVLSSLRKELGWLVFRWSGQQSTPDDVAVTEARLYVSERVREVDEALAEVYR